MDRATKTFDALYKGKVHTPRKIDDRIHYVGDNKSVGTPLYINRHTVLILRVQAAGEVIDSLFLPAHVLNAVRLGQYPPLAK